jgi:hypothetical protein
VKVFKLTMPFRGASECMKTLRWSMLFLDRVQEVVPPWCREPVFKLDPGVPRHR